MIKQRGFTLLELLVVIAIIAVLVSVVLVAIDPVQRINDSQDRAAASNVRATGTLISICVADRLSRSLTFEDCGQTMILEGYGTPPTLVDVASGATMPDDDVCAAQQGSVGAAAHYFVFEHSTGSVEPVPGTLPLPAMWCPGA